jgi:hypothetical protein
MVEIVEFEKFILKPVIRAPARKEIFKISRATLKNDIIPLPIPVKKIIRKNVLDTALNKYPELEKEISEAVNKGIVKQSKNVDKIDEILDMYSDISKIISTELSAIRIQTMNSKK